MIKVALNCYIAPAFSNMIKSKFGTYQFIGQFVLTGLLMLCGFLFYAGFYVKKPVPLISGLGILVVFVTVLLPVYLVAQMKLNYKTVIIDTDLKTISFKMFLLPVTKTYNLNYFDGYINTLVKDKYGTYKCFYLVKAGKLMYKMSGRFYSNIDELHEGLSYLKDLGFLKSSVSQSLKIALGYQILVA
jgi:hypothetical protein